MADFDVPRKVKDELKKVDKIHDRLGMTVDEEVRLLVAVLRCHNFVTTASCGGHLERKTTGPYIDIKSAEGLTLERKLQNSPHQNEAFFKLQDALILANLRDRSRLYAFIENYYGIHSAPFRSMLTTSQKGQGTTRLTCQMAEVMQLPERSTEYKQWLEGAQAEMQAFAKFLCSRL